MCLVHCTLNSDTMGRKKRKKGLKQRFSTVFVGLNRALRLVLEQQPQPSANSSSSRHQQQTDASAPNNNSSPQWSHQWVCPDDTLDFVYQQQRRKKSAFRHLSLMMHHPMLPH